MIMDRIINKVKLYVKDTPKAHNTEKILKSVLLEHNFELNDNDYDLIISVGGDGSFLKMIHKYNFDDTKYYASVNAGSLGYLSSIDNEKVGEFVNDLNNNNFTIKEINLLKVKVYANDVKELYCVNEFTIRKNDFATMKANLYIDDELIEDYNGDGLVISTNTGSTGYNLVLGGPIIDKDLNALSIIPIAPINNKVYKALTNPMIISDKRKVTITLRNNFNICYLSDGIITNLNNISKIECFIDKTIKCIVPKDYNYLKTIKDKVID